MRARRFRRHRVLRVLIWLLACAVFMFLLHWMMSGSHTTDTPRSFSLRERSNQGLPLESAPLPSGCTIASMLLFQDDVSHLVVLSVTLRRRFSSCANCSYRLLVSRWAHHSLDMDRSWEATVHMLRSGGWNSIEVAPAILDEGLVDNEHEVLAQRLLKSLLVCGDAYATVFGAAMSCEGNLIQYFHPRVFIPPQPSVNFCSWFFLGPSQAQLVHSTVERDTAASPVRIVASCISEMLVYGEDSHFSLTHEPDALHVRWMMLSPTIGFSWQSVVSSESTLHCLTRLSATNRVFEPLRDAVKSLKSLYDPTRGDEPCESSYDVLKRSLFRVPLAILNSTQYVDVARRSLGQAFLDLDPIGGLDRHCNLEIQWLIAELEWWQSTVEHGPRKVALHPESSNNNARVEVESQAFVDTQRNLSTSALVVTVGESGMNCIETCRSRKLGCAPSALSWWFPNSCDAMRYIYPKMRYCDEMPDAVLSSVSPGIRASDKLVVVRNVRVNQRNATCTTSHPGINRICTCIDYGEASTAEIETLTPVSLQRLVGALQGDSERLHDDDADATAHAEGCPCPVGRTAAVTEDAEMVCIEYLSNFSNVLDLIPMSNDVKFGRTAKFSVQYRNPCVRGILKPPQRLFPLEPYAEYASFEVDRIFSMKAIPPTSWMFVPIASLERSSARNYIDPGFGKWVSQEVLAYAMKNDLVVTEPAQGRMVLGCSIQLRLPNVQWHRGTPLDFDDRYLELLTPSRAKSRADGSWQHDQEIMHDILKTREQKRNVEEVLPFLSDTIVFDTVVGNGDRSSQKNSHVFTDANGTFRYCRLDQGMSFYHGTVSGKYSLRLGASPTFDQRPSEEGAVVCMFRRSTKRVLDTFFGELRLSSQMKNILPTPIWKAIGVERLYWADARVERIKAYVHRCIEMLGEHAVLVWD